MAPAVASPTLGQTSGESARTRSTEHALAYSRHLLPVHGARQLLHVSSGTGADDCYRSASDGHHCAAAPQLLATRPGSLALAARGTPGYHHAGIPLAPSDNVEKRAEHTHHRTNSRW